MLHLPAALSNVTACVTPFLQLAKAHKKIIPAMIGKGRNFFTDFVFALYNDPLKKLLCFCFMNEVDCATVFKVG